MALRAKAFKSFQRHIVSHIASSSSPSQQLLTNIALFCPCVYFPFHFACMHATGASFLLGSRRWHLLVVALSSRRAGEGTGEGEQGQEEEPGQEGWNEAQKSCRGNASFSSLRSRGNQVDSPEEEGTKVGGSKSSPKLVYVERFVSRRITTFFFSFILCDGLVACCYVSS